MKIIGRLCLFIIFSFLIYCLLIFIVGKYTPQDFKKNLIFLKGGYGHTFTRLDEVRNFSDADILIIGSSLAYRGLDTDIFREYDLKTFNLGTSAQTPIQSEMLLKYYVKELNPKLVLFVVGPGTFGSDGVESSLDVLANLPEVRLEALEMTIRTNHIKTYNTFVYSFMNDALFKSSETFNESVQNEFDTYRQGGFVERKISYFKGDSISPKDYLFVEKQIEAFKRTLRFLDKNAIDYLIIQAPITKTLEKSINQSKEINNFFNSFNHYLDFNRILDLNDRQHFYDAQHLNQEGVILFTREVIDTLLKFKQGK